MYMYYKAKVHDCLITTIMHGENPRVSCFQQNRLNTVQKSNETHKFILTDFKTAYAHRHDLEMKMQKQSERHLFELSFINT